MMLFALLLLCFIQRPLSVFAGQSRELNVNAAEFRPVGYRNHDTLHPNTPHRPYQSNRKQFHRRPGYFWPALDVAQQPHYPYPLGTAPGQYMCPIVYGIPDIFGLDPRNSHRPLRPEFRNFVPSRHTRPRVYAPPRNMRCVFAPSPSSRRFVQKPPTHNGHPVSTKTKTREITPINFLAATRSHPGPPHAIVTFNDNPGLRPDFDASRFYTSTETKNIYKFMHKLITENEKSYVPDEDLVEKRNKALTLYEDAFDLLQSFGIKFPSHNPDIDGLMNFCQSFANQKATEVNRNQVCHFDSFGYVGTEGESKRWNDLIENMKFCQKQHGILSPFKVKISDSTRAFGRDLQRKLISLDIDYDVDSNNLVINIPRHSLSEFF